MSNYHALEVGQLYSPSRTSWPEGCEYNFRSGLHELRLFLANITSREVSQVKRGLARFGLLEQSPSVLFLLFKLGSISWSDAPYNWHMLPEAEKTAPQPLSPAEEVLVTVILIDASTGIVRALRVVSLPNAFSVALHEAIARQIAQPIDRSTYDAAVDAAYARFTSLAMVQSDRTILS